jgi:hypothetical protein
MRSSKNPKVLNYVIRHMLEPIFRKIAELKEVEKWLRERLAEMKAKADSNMEVANDHLNQYHIREKELRDRIDLHNTNLTEMIKRNLLNPNKTGIGEIPIEETKYIFDKSLSLLSYGFRKQEANIIIAGITNKGLAVGEDRNFPTEFTFYNPTNHLFPAYYANDIIRATDESYQDALIATNNGLIEFNILSGEYIRKTTQDGLNTNQITKIARLSNSDSLQKGYIAGTSQGLSYSPNGIRWLNVDKGFTSPVVAFHRSKDYNEIYKEIFIATDKGLYYLDCDKYLRSNDIKIIYPEGINKILPSLYIFSIAIDEDNDILYMTTEKGVIIINDIHSYLNNFNHDELTPDYNIITVQNGLSSSMCFDITVEGTKKIIATPNGLSITEDFINFSYITRKTANNEPNSLENYMCRKIIRKETGVLTIIHPVGFTKEITV